MTNKFSIGIGIGVIAMVFALSASLAFAVGEVTTDAASGITSTDATLNGTNGSSAADNTSFWWGPSSAGPFTADPNPAPQLPPGWSYHPIGTGAQSAGAAFSYLAPGLTPNTTYYFVAWSLVGGTWYPGAVLSFTTAPAGPVFIDSVLNGTLDPGELTFTTIQAAVTAAVSGDTIHVGAGTYTEAGQIVIDKSLSIVGDSFTTVTVKTDTDTTNSPVPPYAGVDSDAWIVVNTGITFNISQVTLDGTGRTIRTAIRYNGNGSVNNVAFQNIGYNPSTDYRGAGVHNASTGNVDVTNSTFTNMGRNGVIYNAGGTGTASGNTYTGKGVGDWLDYAFDIEYGSNVTISNNNVSQNRGVALSDGSTSAAISVWDDAGTQANITGNTLSNNTAGIAIAMATGASDPIVTVGAGNTISNNDVGIDVQYVFSAGSPTLSVSGSIISNNTTGINVQGGISTSNMSVTRNAITGNTSSGATNSGTGNLDASCNWWGHFSGPGPVGPGSGDTISTNVNAATWLTTSDLSGLCNGPLPDVTVTIGKYIDGAHATAASAGSASFPMSSTWNAVNIGAGSGSFALSTVGFNNPNEYEATTANMTPGADYSVSEDTSGSTVGASCAEGKPFVLAGYKIGDTESGAAAAATLPDAVLTSITSNKFIIVLNETCPGTLIIKKVVVRDNGGIEAVTTFSYKINGGASAFFEADGQNDVSLAPGAYSIVEDAATGYTTTYSNSENANANCDNLTITSGGSATCTITNDDIAPSLTLQKLVVNTYGGTSVASDWTLIATGPTGFSGAGPIVANGPSFDAGSYDLSETGPAGYNASAWVCIGGNQTDSDTVVIAPGQNVLCTITNSEIPPPTPPTNACDTPLVAPPGYTLVNGSAGNDNLLLAPFTMFVGNGGNDKVRAGNSNFIICLGSGKDTVTLSGAAAVTIDAGNGDNTITGSVVTGYIKTGSGKDTMALGSGERTILAGEGNNTITANGGGNQTITTGNGDDKIITGSGNDTIVAGNGKNTVMTNAGDDFLTGGADKDTLNGGPGTDTCNAGGGVNTVLNCAP